MKKLFLCTMFVTALAALGATEALAGKVAICHSPPGNPANWHTITISENAVDSHMEKHGDLIGACDENCEALCDDGDFCTQDVQSVANGECVCNAGIRPLIDCGDSNECTADVCSTALGACVNDTGLNDGNMCDDGNEGTVNDMCLGGVCEGDTAAAACVETVQDCQITTEDCLAGCSGGLCSIICENLQVECIGDCFDSSANDDGGGSIPTFPSFP